MRFKTITATPSVGLPGWRPALQPSVRTSVRTWAPAAQPTSALHHGHGLSTGAGARRCRQRRHDYSLGSADSLTGLTANEGKYSKDGYDLAIEAINNAGGVTASGKCLGGALREIRADD